VLTAYRQEQSLSTAAASFRSTPSNPQSVLRRFHGAPVPRWLTLVEAEPSSCPIGLAPCYPNRNQLIPGQFPTRLHHQDLLCYLRPGKVGTVTAHCRLIDCRWPSVNCSPLPVFHLQNLRFSSLGFPWPQASTSVPLASQATGLHHDRKRKGPPPEPGGRHQDGDAGEEARRVALRLELNSRISPRRQVREARQLRRCIPVAVLP
jgi:hypothetical protein